MEHNTTQFIALLSSHIHHNNIHDDNERKIDWEQLYSLGKIHSVSGMLYMSLQEQQRLADIPDTIKHAMKQDFFSTLSRAAEQQVEMKAVIACFDSHQMKHLIFKGHVLKNMYPVPEMRTMGDIDILVQASDRQRCHKLLEKIGYKAIQTRGNVWTYTKGLVRLEIHDHLISRNINQTVDHVSYYNQAWLYSKKTSSNGYTYELALDDHFIYLLVHMAKHFHSTGCGIRMFLDLALFLDRYAVQMKWSYIESQLHVLKLDVFASHVLSLCVRWFDISLPIKLAKMDALLYKQVSEYVCSAGVFGYHRRNGYVAMLRTIGAKRKQTHKRMRAIRNYWSICFPSYLTMRSTATYAFIQGRPYLLPAAWGLRAARGILLRWKHTWKLMIGVVRHKKEYDRQDQLLEKLGL